MENNLKIIKTKENTFEFEVEVDGIDAKDMKIRLMIAVSDMSLAFNAKHVEDSKWSVTIPVLSMLDKTTYPFCIDAIVDGYHFEPMKGSITVFGSAELYVTEPKNVTLAPPKEEVKKDEETVKEKVSATDEIIADLLKRPSPEVTALKEAPLVVPPITLKKIGKDRPVRENRIPMRQPIKKDVVLIETAADIVARITREIPNDQVMQKIINSTNAPKVLALPVPKTTEVTH